MATRKDSIRIAAAAGSWGEDVRVAGGIVSRCAVDYLVMDYLAELTLSIMQAQREKNPELGWATDLLAVLRDLLPRIADVDTAVVTNAGGLNPQACGRAVCALLAELGLADRFTVAVVDGDCLLDRLDSLAPDNAFASLDDAAQPFAAVRPQVLSANAYLGAAPIREALGRGARIVLTGRCADVSLTMGPVLHAFDWTGWDLLATAAVAGHLLECGAQPTGGNAHDWQDMPDLDDVGYPIAEIGRDGSLAIVKAPGTGGRVDRGTVTEQLLHEVFDPRAVLMPDVTVDWTSIELAQAGTDRVEISGVKGAPPPDTLKVSMTYRDGWKVVLMWPYTWPRAVAKARAALAIIEARVAGLGLELGETRCDVFGAGAILGRRGCLAEHMDRHEPVEVFARFAARTPHRAHAQALAAQQAPMIYGPAALAGHIAGGKGQVSRVYAHWATTVRSADVSARVTLPRPEDVHG